MTSTVFFCTAETKPHSTTLVEIIETVHWLVIGWEFLKPRQFFKGCTVTPRLLWRLNYLWNRAGSRDFKDLSGCQSKDEINQRNLFEQFGISSDLARPGGLSYRSIRSSWFGNSNVGQRELDSHFELQLSSCHDQRFSGPIKYGCH